MEQLQPASAPVASPTDPPPYPPTEAVVESDDTPEKEAPRFSSVPLTFSGIV